MHRLRSPGPAFFILGCLAALGSRAEEPTDLVYHRAPTRAVDVFDDAMLLEMPAALAEVPKPQDVLTEGFEAETLQGWTVLGSQPAVQSTGTPLQVLGQVKTFTGHDEAAAPGPRPAAPTQLPETVKISRDQAHGGQRSLNIGAAAPGVLPRLQRTLTVRPQTTYRLTAFVRTEALEPAQPVGVGASVEIDELDAGEDGVALVVHQHLPRERGTTAGWKQLDYSFRTSEMTHRLRLTLEAATGRASGQAFFDDVRLVEIPRIVDLLERDRLVTNTRTGPPHPLLKRMRVEGHDYRPAILAPVPTSWRLGVLPEDDTLLRLELGALARLEGPTNACFRVRWHEEGVSPEEPEPEDDGVLLDECVKLSNPQIERKWQEVTIDLEPYAGRRGELRFETHGGEGDLAVWGNPRLVARRRVPHDERPDIVLIVIDTLRADHLGSGGYGRPTSPVLDELARRSVRFPHAYSASPWTAPSLSSLVTGRYPSQHHGGIRIEREQRHRNPQRPAGKGTTVGRNTAWRNRHLGHLFQRATGLQYHAIAPENVTLAERLRAAGYATVGFHANYNSSGILGFSRGFDHYEMFSGVGVAGARAGVGLARAFLNSRREAGEEGPFFLFLHTQDPHIPYRLRREQFDTFGPAPIDIDRSGSASQAFRPVGRWAVEFWDWARLRTGKAAGELEHVVNFYDSEIAWADRAVGELLHELGDAPNTVIAVTADHGEEFGEHGQYEHGHSLYNEVLKVPFFVRLPGDRHAGAVVDDPVSTIDVAPTLLHLAGVEPLPEAEGRALFAVGAARQRRREGLFAEAMLRGPERRALLTDRYKYIFSLPLGYLVPFPAEDRLTAGLTANVGKEELYDLKSDPGEKENLVSREPGVTADMRRQVFSYLEETAHGLHVRCHAPQGFELRVAATATLAHVQPIRLDEDDVVEIDADRRGWTVRSRQTVSSRQGSDDDWWIARLLAPDAQLILRATSPGRKVRFFVGAEKKAAGNRSLSLKLGDPRLAALPGPAPKGRGPWCQLWQVAGASTSSEALDSDIVKQLKALGYM